MDKQETLRNAIAHYNRIPKVVSAVNPDKISSPVLFPANEVTYVTLRSINSET